MIGRLEASLKLTRDRGQTVREVAGRAGVLSGSIGPES